MEKKTKKIIFLLVLHEHLRISAHTHTMPYAWCTQPPTRTR